MQALSHFSYHYSSRELLLCNLKGGFKNHELILTSLLFIQKEEHLVIINNM